jgi:hypothetical protein
VLPVEGVAVGISKSDHRFFSSVREHAKNLVDGFIADVKEPGRIPHRALAEPEALRYRFQLGVAIEYGPELGGECLHREGTEIRLCFERYGKKAKDTSDEDSDRSPECA